MASANENAEALAVYAREIMERDAVIRGLVTALEGILEWADPYALPDCDRNEKSVEKAQQAISAALDLDAKVTK